MDVKEQLSHYQNITEDAIRKLLPTAETRPARIHSAMRYSMEAGGKRLRPVLVQTVAKLYGKTEESIPAAVAIECLHTYTLIHDDLPGIDNSNLRRGRPTCHKQYDEATAILAGDALLTYAFELLSREYLETPSVATNMVLELTTTSGSQKLIGGQMEDILGENKQLNGDDLDYIHLNKTAALISAALVMGGIVGNASQEDLDKLREVGRLMGLTFQIVDDILDVTSDPETMGKDTGLDAENHKSTYVTLHGLESSREKAHAFTQKAISIARELPGDTEFLVNLIGLMEQRLH